MTQIDDTVDQWLRDAHAMEEQAEQMLSAQARRIENYPEVATRIQAHIEETRSQRDRIEECLRARGTDASGMKDMTAKASAMMQALGGAAMGDEVVKGAMSGYTFEHMEIAAYTTLAAAARAAGDMRTAQVCDEILREEVAMADWLAEHLPQVATTFLQRDEADSARAKR
jgi:ferritin-like metal-binding protein YciE